ncbi:MAG: LysR family transcriptional regulator [Rhodobacteraceae bacterium]|nr:LysR family transcriptional regulator [Paracoccaceae bacterium]
MLKLEHLRTFITVADTGNIADAAEMLGRTPSAVSMTLKQLEGDIGGALFQSDRKSNLTALGRFTLDNARAQISGFDASVRTIRAYAAHEIGRLAIASVPSVATILLPSALATFLGPRPGLEVELLDADSRSVARMVDAGSAEIGIAGPPQETARLTFAPLICDRFRVVHSASDPLAAITRPLDWQDLHDASFIRNEAADAIDLPELRERYYAATLMVRNVASLLAMVREGLGVTLLPTLATINLPAGLQARDVDFRGAERIVGMITRTASHPSPVAAAFVRHFHQSLAASAPALGIEAL